MLLLSILAIVMTDWYTKFNVEAVKMTADCHGLARKVKAIA